MVLSKLLLNLQYSSWTFLSLLVFCPDAISWFCDPETFSHGTTSEQLLALSELSPLSLGAVTISSCVLLTPLLDSLCFWSFSVCDESLESSFFVFSDIRVSHWCVDSLVLTVFRLDRLDSVAWPFCTVFILLDSPEEHPFTLLIKPGCDWRSLNTLKYFYIYFYYWLHTGTTGCQISNRYKLSASIQKSTFLYIWHW